MSYKRFHFGEQCIVTAARLANKGLALGWILFQRKR